MNIYEAIWVIALVLYDSMDCEKRSSRDCDDLEEVIEWLEEKLGEMAKEMKEQIKRDSRRESSWRPRL